MFLDVKELAVRKLRIHKLYPQGTIDYHTEEFQQVDPLEVRGTAELVDGQIRLRGSCTRGWNWSARVAWTR